MSQTQTILRHLQQGKSITHLEAFGVYGVHRLAARIHDLRGQGHDIISTEHLDERGRRYVRYAMGLSELAA